MNDKTHAQGGEPGDIHATDGAPFNHGFRLAERITLQPVGGDSVELTLAGSPTTKTVPSSEIAGLLQEKYFSD